MLFVYGIINKNCYSSCKINLYIQIDTDEWANYKNISKGENHERL